MVKVDVVFLKFDREFQESRNYFGLIEVGFGLEGLFLDLEGVFLLDGAVFGF